ncbi:MAG: hypothetical protein M3N43_06465 [Actinomycetota bacterium]|nr:hypothetical protein [Actinomycetota bacterium]
MSLKVQRHLTIREVRMMREFKDDTSDVLAIQLACGVTKEEAVEFFETAPAGVVADVLQDIMRRSGLLEDAQFPVAQGDDAEPSREDG